MDQFPFTDADFKVLCDLVSDHAGIQLYGADKRTLVYTRLTRRLRILEMSSFDEYIQFLKTEFGSMQEFSHCINALTTNHTTFFRESYHFEYLVDTVMPAIFQRNAESKQIRIWSSGCSSGEEPYSIAMTLAPIIPEDWDVRILATDIDSNMINHGKQGIYTLRSSEIDDACLKNFFLRGRGDRVRIKDAMREMVSFRRLNLLDEPWPMRKAFDVIFCRNVVIYFNSSVQEKLFCRYATSLQTGGFLFVGHSENLRKFNTPFASVAPTIYSMSK